MGSCMVQSTPEREHTFTPINSLAGGTQLSGRTTLRGLQSSLPAGALFRSESDQSDALTQSVDNLAKQLGKSQLWQEGTSHSAKFEHVIAETRMLEAKLEALKHQRKSPATRKSYPLTDSPEEYLAWEQQLEEEICAIQAEMARVKQDVEDLQDHVRTISLTTDN